MADISVSVFEEDQYKSVFKVEVVEKDSSTMHLVTVNESDYEELTDGKIDPAELIRKSFEFLLAREPKESILKEFNLMRIAQYFPEFPEDAKKFS